MIEINLMIKGFVIGLAKIFPGISGSLIALNLGLYEKGINAISNFFKNKRENIRFLFNVGIGVIVGTIFGGKCILFLLEKNYFLAMSCFLGLLIGSNISTVMYKRKNNVLMIIVFLISLSTFFIKTDNNFVYSNTFGNNFYTFILGIIDALSTIVPCLSGSAMFMLLGSYEFVINIFSNFYHLNYIIPSIFFFLGLSFGIIVISKLISNILETKKELFTSIVSGLFLSSIIYILLETIKRCSGFSNFLIGLIIFINSFVISLVFSHDF